MDIGSIVRLNSGGPLMSIIELNSDQTLARCLWFTEKGKIKQSWFSINQLDTHYE